MYHRVTCILHPCNHTSDTHTHKTSIHESLRPCIHQGIHPSIASIASRTFIHTYGNTWPFRNLSNIHTRTKKPKHKSCSPVANTNTNIRPIQPIHCHIRIIQAHLEHVGDHQWFAHRVLGLLQDQLTLSLDWLQLFVDSSFTKIRRLSPIRVHAKSITT